MEKMNLSEIGKIAQKYWLEIPQHFSYVTLGECVIMPNHVHGIVIIDNNNAETLQPIQTLQRTETLQCNVSTIYKIYIIKTPFYDPCCGSGGMFVMSEKFKDDRF